MSTLLVAESWVFFVFFSFLPVLILSFPPESLSIDFDEEEVSSLLNWSSTLS